VGGYWTFGFICKFLLTLFGQSLYQVATTEMLVFQACIVALCDFFSMVIPIYLVTEAHFINIFSAKCVGTQLRSLSLNLDAFESLLSDQDLSSVNFGARDTQIDLQRSLSLRDSVDRPSQS
jgi:hypothetical protein